MYFKTTRWFTERRALFSAERVQSDPKWLVDWPVNVSNERKSSKHLHLSTEWAAIDRWHSNGRPSSSRQMALIVARVLLIDPCPFDEQFTFNQVLEASAWIFWKKFNTFGRVDGAERSVGELNEMQIEGLILNEFDIHGYHSIALRMIYRTSFEFELIWWADWS